MNISKKLQFFRFEQYLKKPAMDSILLTFGVAGWLTSMLAQDIAIITNKNIPADKKKFLLPQETADGLCNSLMLIAFTTGMKSIVYKLFDKGKLLPGQASEELNEVAQECKNIIEPFVDKEKPGLKTLRDKILYIISDKTGNAEQKTLFKILKEDIKKSINTIATTDKGIDGILDEIKGNELDGTKLSQNVEGIVKRVASILGKEGKESEIIKNLSSYRVRSEVLSHLAIGDRKYFKYKSGLGNIVAVLGGIFAANIFAPIFRNNVGAYFKQKADLEEYKKNPYSRVTKTNKVISYPKTYTTFTNITNI